MYLWQLSSPNNALSWNVSVQFSVGLIHLQILWIPLSVGGEVIIQNRTMFPFILQVWSPFCFLFPPPLCSCKSKTSDWVTEICVKPIDHGLVKWWERVNEYIKNADRAKKRKLNVSKVINGGQKGRMSNRWFAWEGKNRVNGEARVGESDKSWVRKSVKREMRWEVGVFWS
jgi:hypothetical protein